MFLQWALSPMLVCAFSELANQWDIKGEQWGTVKHIYTLTHERSSALLQGFLLHQRRETRLPRLPQRKASDNQSWMSCRPATNRGRLGKKQHVCLSWVNRWGGWSCCCLWRRGFNTVIWKGYNSFVILSTYHVCTRLHHSCWPWYCPLCLHAFLFT